MEIALHLGLAPRRHPVRLLRGGQQRRRLHLGEHLRGPLPGGAVHPHPRPHPAPVLRAALRILDAVEVLPGEETALGEFHAVFHPPLILRRPDPGRIHDQAAGLRVLQPLPVPPRLQPVCLIHHRLEVVRHEHREHAAKKAPCRLTPGDHRGRRLRERQIHEAVPGQHRGEHQRVQPPPPVPVADHPQVAEIQLHLLARFPVGHRHRHLLPRRGGVPALPGREPRQRPVRHRRPRAFQQLMNLHQRQAGLHPPGDLGLPRHQHLPRGAVPGRAGRAHRPDHLPQQLITQLRLIPATGQARRLRRPDIPRSGLHIHARPPGRRALTRPGQPRPQDLHHLCHQNLPERHPLPSLPVRNEPEDHSRVVHQLANQVVPSPWQQPSAGGPMLMADDMGGQLISSQ